jgi:hypothetical protein
LYFVKNEQVVPRENFFLTQQGKVGNNPFRIKALRKKTVKPAVFLEVKVKNLVKLFLAELL